MGTLIAHLPMILSIVGLLMMMFAGINKSALTVAAVTAMALFVIVETTSTRTLAFNTAALGGLLAYVAVVLIVYLKWKKTRGEGNITEMANDTERLLENQDE